MGRDSRSAVLLLLFAAAAQPARAEPRTPVAAADFGPRESLAGQPRGVSAHEGEDELTRSKARGKSGS